MTTKATALQGDTLDLMIDREMLLNRLLRAQSKKCAENSQIWRLEDKAHSLLSLWTMLKLDPELFLHPLSYIGATLSEWRFLQHMNGKPYPRFIPMETKVDFLKSIEHLNKAAKLLGMSITQATVESGFEEALQLMSLKGNLSAAQLEHLITFGDKVSSVFELEANTRVFMVLEPRHATFLHSETPLFGESVDDAFPLASQEIVDAGKCRAAGLWTSLVMHLMRALEDALNSLARYLDVDIGQNWNTALNQIDAKLKERSKSAFGADEEQWASEASAHLRAIKNAWRNHAQHGRVRYSEEEAVSIWNNVQSLMRTLSKRLSA